MQKQKSSSPRLLSGVLILTASNLTVKLLGLLCKVPLQDVLGDKGMGYFNIAYNIFTTLYLVATAGMPAALTSIQCVLYDGTSWRDGYAGIFQTACRLGGKQGFLPLYYGDRADAFLHLSIQRHARLFSGASKYGADRGQ